MSNPHDSAFPHDLPKSAPLGLTKRELFAAMICQGAVAALGSQPELRKSITDKMLAERSVEQADALIAELAKEPA